MITKDLGAVSAYAYAVEKGYTGTEAEFAELMASYATVAEQASQSASDAQIAKTASETAKGIAESARDEAESARDDAQQSATTASQKAQEASQSASESSQSASTAVQAKQDAQTAKTASETAQASAESARDDAETARDEAQQYAESIDPQKLIGAYPVDTATGAIASFSDGADDIPMKDVLVHIEPVQDLHGYDSPWPAGGGKNKCLPYTEMASNNDVSYTVTDNGVKINGTASGASFSWANIYASYASALIKLPAGTYTFSTSVLPTDSQTTSYLAFMGYTESGTAITSIVLSGTTLSKNATFSEPVGIYYGFYIASGQQISNVECKLMIESGSSKTDFAPYSNICPISGWTGAQVNHSGADTSNPTTYPITFPTEAGTIYGGTLDVTTGELVVDRANIASYNGETLPSTWISDRDAYAQGATPTIGAQVVYELAEPITLTLSPTEVRSLLGENNVWADAGDSTVTYRADTALYINRKIAEAVSALS